MCKLRQNLRENVQIATKSAGKIATKSVGECAGMVSCPGVERFWKRCRQRQWGGHESLIFTAPCVFVLFRAVPYNSYASVRFSTLPYTLVRFSTRQYASVHFSTIQYGSVRFTRFSAIQHSSMRFSATLYNPMRFGPNPSVSFRCVPFRLLLAVLLVWWDKVLAALSAVGLVLQLAVAHLIRLYQCWNCIRDLWSASPGGHPLLESTQMQAHPIFFGSFINQWDPHVPTHLLVYTLKPGMYPPVHYDPTRYILKKRTHPGRVLREVQ
eukprot:gene20679-biopygen20620